MPEKPTKTTYGMPGWARIIAAVFGVVLLGLGVGVACLVRPANWEVGVMAVSPTLFALDLLGGAIRGKWPIAIFLAV